MTARSLALLVWLFAGNVGCAGRSCSSAAAREDARTPAYASVIIPNVPHVLQKPDFCGEAVTESWLRALGYTVTQDQVFELSGMDPERGMGATTRELYVALQRLGFQTGPVFGHVAAKTRSALDAQFDALHRDLMQGIPSIVCTHFDERPDTTEHFRLVLGYDAKLDQVIYHEPAYADAGYQRMPRERFLALWPLKYSDDEWTVIRLRLAGKPTFVPPPVSGLAAADFAQHVMKLQKGRAGAFRIVTEPPFVVIGDEDLPRVRAVAAGTVRWAVRQLRKDFFARDPNRILDIWLFKNEASYNANAQRLFGEAPTTPFGYYSSRADALVMNIATGGGTLVHEIVHPYIEANFPRCPAWFNEGLGSLFEQSTERDGHIVGLTNWRLKGLQQRIRRGALPKFESLLSSTDAQFYTEDEGSNYGQARYLLYYLQEQGLLREFYQEFSRNRAGDPTGKNTLMRMLAVANLGEFQRRWEAWVLTLRFVPS
ncbi:MAG TPA: C39 family peptidase [Polyangiaceae bacterium]